MTQTLREWMVGHPDKVAAMTATEISRQFGVTRQRVQQIATEEQLDVVRVGSAGSTARRIARITAAYARVFGRTASHLMSWRDVANRLGVSLGCERQWSALLSDEDYDRYTRRLQANRLRRDGPPYHAQVATLITRRPHHYSARMLGEKLGVSEAHARIALYRAIELTPALAGMYVRRYRTGER